MTSAAELRHALHAYPELSGEESATAARLKSFFAPLCPDETVEGLGGSGIAFVFSGPRPGPTVLLRAELDALPIDERIDLPHRSRRPGVSHKCGHDGHMAILAAVGEVLARERPARGRVVLLFQPAEETGAGAQAVVADPGFARIRPDAAFGLHNVPGFPRGQLVVRAGTFSCASRGLVMALAGRPAHAAQPETGRSPARALAALIEGFYALPGGIAEDGELCFATVVGANMGGANFGVAPGDAELCVTLRAETDATMARLVAHAEALLATQVERYGLSADARYCDVFDATVNSPAAVELIRNACRDLDLVEAAEPFRWSEDFGRFTQVAEGAFFGLGAGMDVPALHNDDYDFPDALIETGREAFLRIARAALGGDA